MYASAPSPRPGTGTLSSTTPSTKLAAFPFDSSCELVASSSCSLVSSTARLCPKSSAPKTEADRLAVAATASRRSSTTASRPIESGPSGLPSVAAASSASAV